MRVKLGDSNPPRGRRVGVRLVFHLIETLNPLFNDSNIFATEILNDFTSNLIKAQVDFENDIKSLRNFLNCHLWSLNHSHNDIIRGKSRNYID